jgi:hypothetical protein
VFRTPRARVELCDPHDFTGRLTGYASIRALATTTAAVRQEHEGGAPPADFPHRPIRSNERINRLRRYYRAAGALPELKPVYCQGPKDVVERLTSSGRAANV